MKRKITISISWVGVMLLCMGIIFGGIGVGVGMAVNLSSDMTPEDAHVFTIVFTGMFGLFGVVMLTVGAIILARAVRAVRRRNALIEAGNYIWADIIDVSLNRNIQINDRYPYILRCQYRHIDGNNYVFKSGYLRYNPCNLMGERVKVWFDRDNIKKYYVDVEGSLTNDIIEL